MIQPTSPFASAVSNISAQQQQQMSFVTTLLPMAERLMTGFFDRMDRQNDMMREFMKEQNALMRELLVKTDATAHRAADRALTTSRKRESHAELDVNMYKTLVAASAGSGLMVFSLEMACGADLAARDRVMLFDLSTELKVDVAPSVQTCADMFKLKLSLRSNAAASLCKFVARKVNGKSENWSDMLTKSIRDELLVITKHVFAVTGRTLVPVPMSLFMAKIGQCREAHFEDPTDSCFQAVNAAVDKYGIEHSAMIRAAVEDVCKTTTNWLSNRDGEWVPTPWSTIDAEIAMYDRIQRSRDKAKIKTPRRYPVPGDDDDDDASAGRKSPQPRLIISATAVAGRKRKAAARSDQLVKRVKRAPEPDAPEESELGSDDDDDE